MATLEAAAIHTIARRDANAKAAPRHSLLVRVTHWINALSFLALLGSGITILLAHPRFYWGETGTIQTPSLFDLPLPFVLQNPIRGPGRYVHFLSAWVCILTGLIYVASGLWTRHFRKNLLPARADLSWRSLVRVLGDHLRLKPYAGGGSYNVLQRLTYLGVVFFLFPMLIWTGLAMSPSITSAFPSLVEVLGGQQSARTIHFFAACAAVLFVMVHLTMILLSGLVKGVLSMITGRRAPAKEGL